MLTKLITFTGKLPLNHWGRVTHICVCKLTIIASDNGLAPGRRQAIIWTNAAILLIRPLWTKFSEILIDIYIYIFPFQKMHLKMSSGKGRSFCFGFNVLLIWRWKYATTTDRCWSRIPRKGAQQNILCLAWLLTLYVLRYMTHRTVNFMNEYKLLIRSLST